MKYDQPQALQEILRRRDVLVEKRQKKAVRALEGTTVVLGVLLLAVFRQAAGAGGKWLGPSDYGSFLLSEAAGGYVLAGVLAFAAGVAAAVLIRRRAENKQGGNDGFIEREELEEGEDR